jgi:hypothetical protein
LDVPSASAALEALQAESAWALSEPLLAACMEAGAVLSPLLLQHILLVATQDKSFRIAKEVLQVRFTSVTTKAWCAKPYCQLTLMSVTGTGACELSCACELLCVCWELRGPHCTALLVPQYSTHRSLRRFDRLALDVSTSIVAAASVWPYR